jgi:ferredoxin--NADP+ reductase
MMRLIHDELAIMRVKPDAGVPNYLAGQYTSMGLGFWERRAEGCQEEALEPGQLSKVIKRAYSISSPILGTDGQLLRRDEETFLEFYIALVRTASKRPPALTPRLFLLRDGDRLFVADKITGRYTLESVKPDDMVLLLATGTGEAPHNKMILDLARAGHRGRIASVVCVRYERDLAYLETHQRLQQMLPNYLYVTLTTREARNRNNKVYIQDLIRTDQLEERIGQPLDPSRTHAFLCGNPQMIGVPKRGAKEGEWVYPQPQGAIELLVARGFQMDRPRHPGNIHFEEYW